MKKGENKLKQKKKKKKKKGDQPIKKLLLKWNQVVKFLLREESNAFVQ